MLGNLTYTFNPATKCYDISCYACGYSSYIKAEVETERDGIENYYININSKRCPNCEWHDHVWVPLGIKDGKMTVACWCGFFKRIEAKEIKG